MKDYCTQNNGDCFSCSLVNYGRDCENNSLDDEPTAEEIKTYHHIIRELKKELRKEAQNAITNNMKNVALIIQVPESEFCFDGKECCCYFDNEGGHGTCDLKIGYISGNNFDGKYKKPKECIKLQKV